MQTSTLTALGQPSAGLGTATSEGASAPAPAGRQPSGGTACITSTHGATRLGGGRSLVVATVFSSLSSAEVTSVAASVRHGAGRPPSASPEGALT